MVKIFGQILVRSKSPSQPNSTQQSQRPRIVTVSELISAATDRNTFGPVTLSPGPWDSGCSFTGMVDKVDISNV